MSLEIQLTMPEIARQAKKAKALKIKLLRIIKIENEFDLTVFSLYPLSRCAHYFRRTRSEISILTFHLFLVSELN